ncbi:MAG TPA: hypothetical protein VKU40_05960 [Thermoanaerobaculia bacterium]|nr:hypothetical protein [Thermoanaerobaculia bacterium]
MRKDARRLPQLVAAAFVRAAKPGPLLLFLAVNLGAAVLLALPLATLASAELDDNLYGDEMATGASWRWFHTVERQHPRAVGEYGAWTALLSEDGVRWSDVRALSGPPAAIAWAALFLFLLHAPLHVGWLTVRRRSGPRTGALLSAAVARAPAALLLALLAALAYAAVYTVAFVAPADWLRGWSEGIQSERLHLVFVALRLALTLALLFVVKLGLDLAKVGLAAGDGWNLAGSIAGAGRELLRRGPIYAALYIPPLLAMALVAALWWWLAGALVPAAFLGFAILFLLQQLFVALRIALRLTALGAVQGLYEEAARRARMTTPSSTL